MADPNARDAKLIQYLNEAHGKEKELETALQAHIAMTTRAPYKKRLQQHLKETKAHAKQVERRIKKLGGKAEGGSAVADVVSAAQTVTRKGAALAQGPVHAVRGTGEQEKLLKNAKTQYQDEAEEIATYTAIETLADTVGDKETAQLARGIRREEERMAKFIEKQIPTLTKAVAQDEIPSELRKSSSSRRRRSSSGRASSSRKSSSRKSSSRGKSARSSSRSASSRGGSSRGRASSGSRSSRSGGSRSSGSRSRSGS